MNSSSGNYFQFNFGDSMFIITHTQKKTGIKNEYIKNKGRTCSDRKENFGRKIKSIQP
jgi:hypothetical protein